MRSFNHDPIALDLPRLAAIARGADATAVAVPVAGDGRYQRDLRSVAEVTALTAESLRRSLAGRDTDAVPELLLCWGKCRVGSTALANVFGHAGISAYYQPLKTIARHVLSGGDVSNWPFPGSNAKAVFIKETGGPYVLIECLLNPLEILLTAGYPAGRIKLLLLERDPLSTFDSWLQKWGGRIADDRLLTHFVCASLNLTRIRSFAEQHSVHTIHYAYEAAVHPHTAVRNLFLALGFGDLYSPAVTLWGDLNLFDSPASKVIFPVEPPIYTIDGLHRTTGEYRFLPRQLSFVQPNHERVIESFGLGAIYEDVIRRCATDLQLPFETVHGMRRVAEQRARGTAPA